MGNDDSSSLIEQLIRKHGLSAHAETLRSLALPSIRIKATRCRQEDIGPGDSHFGAEPYLPDGMKWPFFRGLPLGHVCMIRLSEASPHDRSGLLPREGLLYFWFDYALQDPSSDEAGNPYYRLDFVRDENIPLTRSRTPLDRVESGIDIGCHRDMPMHPCKLEFEAALTLPHSAWIQEFRPECSDLAELDAYWELISDLDGDKPCHRLLGHSNPIQSPVELYCIDESSVRDQDEMYERAAAWRLLLQIDTDEEGPGWMWGDCGTLYYMIQDVALRKHDFCGVHSDYQCY